MPDQYEAVIINDTDQQRVVRIEGLTSSGKYDLVTTVDGVCVVDRGQFERV